MTAKLEVGMYVRIKGYDDVAFGKLHEQVEDSHLWTVETKDGYYDLSPEYDFEKASFNIIDLIEVGDILHSKYDNEWWTVQEHQGPKEPLWIQTEWEVIENEKEFFETFDEIITKEQAKSVSYKVGD